MVLIAGSHASEQREPGQAGNGAAISDMFVVPWNNLAGAGCADTLGKVDSEKSARSFLVLSHFFWSRFQPA